MKTYVYFVSYIVVNVEDDTHGFGNGEVSLEGEITHTQTIVDLQNALKGEQESLQYIVIGFQLLRTEEVEEQC